MIKIIEMISWFSYSGFARQAPTLGNSLVYTQKYWSGLLISESQIPHLASRISVHLPQIEFNSLTFKLVTLVVPPLEYI